jgi:hypothetical protein
LQKDSAKQNLKVKDLKINHHSSILKIFYRAAVSHRENAALNSFPGLFNNYQQKGI